MATSVDSESKDFQKFLDEHQYTREGILSYEYVFGHTYVSTGGADTTKKILAEMDLKPGQRVLDIGCGIGGGDIEMARAYGASVLGIDLSKNMLAIGADRLAEATAAEGGIGAGSVELQELDCTTAEFKEASFDVVYSRDTLLHIKDKPALFKRLFHWVKPGGKVVITDYCRGDATSEEFESYVAQRGYVLLTVPEYGKALESAGFTDVAADNVTDVFVDCLKRERERTVANRDAFVEKFGRDQFDYLLKGWDAKLERCPAGYQTWGKFVATKPAAAAPAEPTSTA